MGVCVHRVVDVWNSDRGVGTTGLVGTLRGVRIRCQTALLGSLLAAALLVAGCGGASVASNATVTAGASPVETQSGSTQTTARPSPTLPAILPTATAPGKEAASATSPASASAGASLVPTAAPAAPASTVAAAGAPPAPAVPATATLPPVGQKTALLTTASWVERAADFGIAQPQGVVLAPGDGVRLASQGSGYVAAGEYLSPVREAEFPFDNAVLSWNADAPADTLIRLELRVRSGDRWSRWYGMGEWGPNGGKSVTGQADGMGEVDIDTLVLKQPANALQYRARLESSAPGNSPLLRQVAVAYSDLSKGLSGPTLPRPEGGARDLDVPQHSQLDEDPAVATTICSPTSLAMVMQYWGAKKSVAEVYAGVRDQTARIYGNWPLNAAYAGANGFDARVDRFYSLEQLEQEIAAGRPAIVSVAYGSGELTGAAAASTSGHLIVVRGFTASGDVIVNDPIAPSSRSVRLVYKRDQFRKVWLRSGGIVYLVQPRV